jgi:hypothetical protein
MKFILFLYNSISAYFLLSCCLVIFFYFMGIVGFFS